jgi:PAS domain S-box-containing protein
LGKIIADLNHTIERLRQSEQLLKVITEKSFAGVYVVQNGEFKFANANAVSYTGYDAGELIGKECDSIIHPEDLKKAKMNSRAMLRGERSLPYEFRIITKNGRIRWIAETVTPITYEGKPAILGNSMDITDRKLAEDALHESERRLADIIEFLPDATVAINLEGKVIAWNRAIEKMTGVKARDMLGKGNYEHALPFYGERRPIIVDLVLQSDEAIEKTYLLLSGGQKKKELIVETWATRLNRFLWGKASPLYDNKRNIVGAIEVIRDITDRKLAEDALRESERRLADIIEFLPDATVAINLEGKVIAWNRAIEKMTGVSTQHMLGKGDYEYALPFYGKRRPIIIDLVLKPDEAVEKSYLFSEKQKNELVVETWAPCINAFLWGKASPLYDNKRNIVGAIEVIRDITDRKLAEDALRESERRLADIIEFLPDAAVAINLDGKVIAWNRATEELTGVKAKDMLGKGNHESSLPFWKIRRPMAIDLVLEPNRKFEKTYTVFKRETNTVLVEVEVPGIQIKGRNAYLWGKASPLYNNKGNIVGAIEVLRDITERKLAEEALKKRERELKMKSHELEELNTALTVLLKRRENDKKELEEMLLVNVKELVLPYVEELKSKMKGDKDMTYIKILDANLRNIISPFSNKLSLKYMSLTNREVRVAELIKEGKSSKEIADLLSVTESSININRYRIRKKLGLKKQDNLKVYFLSLQ